MAKQSDALDRILEHQQREMTLRIERDQRTVPAYGLDRGTNPPLDELARLELEARSRWSPRKPLWPEVARLDAEIAAADQQHEAATSSLDGLRSRLAAAPRDRRRSPRRLDREPAWPKARTHSPRPRTRS